MELIYLLQVAFEQRNRQC